LSTLRIGKRPNHAWCRIADGTHRPIVYSEYDNLGEVTVAERRQRYG
jgi:hypothetical protein